jgi:hypothetical protein
MGIYTANVEEHLVLPARVSLTEDERRVFKMLGRTTAEPIDIRLIVDTGSRRTCLSPAIIDQLRPLSQGRLRVETSLASGETTLFWMRLEFPESTLHPVAELSVARLQMPRGMSKFDGVLGRDVLRRWHRLAYEGRRGRLVIRDLPPSLFDWFRG